MRKILATLSIIPSLLLAVLVWIISLPHFLWEVPKDIYYRILLDLVLVKVKENDDGTYTVSYKGKEETLTKEEFDKRFGKYRPLK